MIHDDGKGDAAFGGRGGGFLGEGEEIAGRDERYYEGEEAGEYADCFFIC